MKFEIGAMTVGDILDRGLKILLARLGTFYVISLLTLWPLLLLQLAAPLLTMSGPTTAPDPAILLGGMGGVLGALVLLIVLAPIGTAAVLHIIGQEYVDEPAGVGDSFRFALGRFLPLLGTSILYGLLMIVGYFACCVGAIYVAVFYGLFAQIVVMENLGGMDALNRSKDLVTGFGWRVFGLLILLVIITLMIQLTVTLPLRVVLPATETVQTQFGPQEKLISYPNFAIQTAVAFLISIVAQSYQSVCFTLLYFDLRIRKEGFDLELAARKPGLDQEGAYRDESQAVREGPLPPAGGPRRSPSGFVRDDGPAPGRGDDSPEDGTGIEPA